MIMIEEAQKQLTRYKYSSQPLLTQFNCTSSFLGQTTWSTGNLFYSVMPQRELNKYTRTDNIVWAGHLTVPLMMYSRRAGGDRSHIEVVKCSWISDMESIVPFPPGKDSVTWWRTTQFCERIAFERCDKEGVWTMEGDTEIPHCHSQQH
jgi:hypothetical protein